MLYEKYETEISQGNLRKVFSEIPLPLCLLGGWATYLTVNEKFYQSHGRNYHGSKDIDLGFHIEKTYSDSELTNSMFSKTISVLEKNGFYLLGSRLVQHFHIETKRSLTEEESRKIATYNMFDLYVDPIVDSIHPKMNKILRINPIDEPILREVFENKKFKLIDAFGAKIMLPLPEVLLATKINSVLNRQKDHKRIKDIVDIYALIWHSNTDPKILLTKLSEIVSKERIAEVISKFTDKDYTESAKAIGIEKTEIENVIKSFISKGALESVVAQNKQPDEESKEEKWRIPVNIGYDTLKVILNSLYQKNADKNHVSSEDISKVTGLQRTAVTMNLSFLESIDVIKGDSKSGFMFTNAGSELAKSLSMDNRDLIKRNWQEVIQNSHLNDLMHYIENYKDNLSTDKLFKYIKTQARAPDGPSSGGMAQPYATGSRTLLLIFGDADLLPEQIISELQEKKKSSKPKQMSRQKPKQTNIQDEDTVSINVSESSSDVVGRIIVNGVGYIDIKDQDSLNIAGSYLEMIKKKIEEHDSKE